MKKFFPFLLIFVFCGGSVNENTGSDSKQEKLLISTPQELSWCSNKFIELGEYPFEMQKLDDIYEYGLEMKKYIEELRVLDAAISESQLTEIEVYNISKSEQENLGGMQTFVKFQEKFLKSSRKMLDPDSKYDELCNLLVNEFFNE